MAEAFIQILLDNLSSLIKEEVGLIMGVDAEMNKLFSTLTTIQAVVEDAEMKQIESRAIQNWLAKLNDLTYEIDDILDECATELTKLEHKSSRYSLKSILFRRKIGRRMKQVTENLDMVATERAKFHLREMVVERPMEIVASRETGSTLNEPHRVYGRQEDTEKIVEILINQINNNEEISVLPIIGVGGLGKTTLAQLVFNDPRVLEHYDEKLWVCVSDNFDLKTLLKALIEYATGSTSDLARLVGLQRHLWELLNQKKYLIVLDDVWNECLDKWSDLRNVLACGSIGSSIIVTTRLKMVGDIMGTHPPHYLMGLSDEHCWMLLQERAFRQEEKEKFPNLEAIGKQIVKKCAGVPLAAKALGGLLRFKRTEKDWIYVHESEIWELPQEEALILPALRLSYHHLPLQLRRCFAYCAVYPKDSEISREELVFMWMAHGYISSKGALEVEDVGNDVCNALVLRSLLQDVPRHYQPKVVMHDLVHDLAQSIMENKIPGRQAQRNVGGAFGHSKIRQVNFTKKFIAFPVSYQYEMDMSFILTNFCRLRTLDASLSGIKDLPSTIGNMRHLRQLNLSGTEIVSLPDSICSLSNLQVLNLHACKELVALPKNMRRLFNLRHLFLALCWSLSEMPPKIRELTHLRTLSQFIVGHKRGNQLEELQCLNLSGMLTIHRLERVENHVDAKKANLAEKKNLNNLKLEWEGDNADDKDEKVLEALEPHPNLKLLEIEGFRGRYFPIWMSNATLKKVSEIRIRYCEYCVCLPQLGELPHLRTLTLTKLPVEYIVEDSQVQENSIQFPSLESLHLQSLPNLKGLLEEQVIRSEAFPNLEDLTITDCSSLTVPSLSSLKKLKTLRCSSLTLASLSKLNALTELGIEIEENMKCISVETLQSLTSIKVMNIVGAYEQTLPEEGLPALKFLTKLGISGLDTVRCVPEGWLRHLTTLEELLICECQDMVELPAEGIKHLKFLKKVRLFALPKMVHVPKALQQISSSLQSLELHRLHNLELLPDWLEGLTSLESLRIYDCPKLASIPNSFRGIPNLRYLFIKRCLTLEKRCERGIGADWHKISHIRRLVIGER